MAVPSSGDADPVRREYGGSPLDRLRLRRVGPREPAPQRESVAGRLEKDAAVDDRHRTVHPEPHSLDHRREMPGIDQPTVGCRLAADRVEPAAPAPGGDERMSGQHCVEASDRACGVLEVACQQSEVFKLRHPAGSPLRREFTGRDRRHWRRRRQRMWLLTLMARRRPNADEPGLRL